MRWEHPERGLIEPGEFVPMAEETGLIVPIGEWVIEQALGQVRRWRQSRPGMTISVNLSPRQLGDPGLPGRLTNTMREGGHDPSVLCLEVSEGALDAEPEVATRQLSALREMGVARHRRLRHRPVVAGHAAPDARRHSQDRPDARLADGRGCRDVATVGAAVELGHALGLTVVAEGVETDAQLAHLRELGCDGAQGYLFSPPVPEESVYSLLATA